jgi:hypothetical protein
MLRERGCGNQGDETTIVPVNGGSNHQEYLCDSPQDNIGYKGRDSASHTVKYCGKLPFLIPSCPGYCRIKQTVKPQVEQSA